MFGLITLEVTPFSQNCRLLFCPKSLEAVVVDPGGDAELILAELSKRNLNCSQIWLTHSHLDHCGGVADLIAATKAKLIGHEIEKEMRAHVVDICSMYGLPPNLMKNCPEPDQYIKGGEVLRFSEYEFETLFTPGHSPGHLCFFHRPSSTLLAGDTLFNASIGRTDLPGGDHKTLLKSIKNVLFALPKETKVLPGHGPDTTISKEMVSNPFLV